MKPFGHLAVPFLAICPAYFPTSAAAAAATAAAQSEPQLVRVSYMQGDVRFNHGDAKQPNLKKPWEQADVNLPIAENYALATGADGRAEIEFESGSVIYVAENSVVLFEELTATNAHREVSNCLPGKFIRSLGQLPGCNGIHAAGGSGI